MASFVKYGLLPKRINELESDKIEIVTLEININKRKWIILSIYRRLQSNVENLWKKYPRYWTKPSLNIKRVMHNL